MAVMHESLSPENRATFLGAMREWCAYNPQGLDQYYSSDVLWLLDEIDYLERMLQASNQQPVSTLEEGNDGVYHRQTYRDSDVKGRVGF